MSHFDAAEHGRRWRSAYRWMSTHAPDSQAPFDYCADIYLNLYEHSVGVFAVGCTSGGACQTLGMVRSHHLLMLPTLPYKEVGRGPY